MPRYQVDQKVRYKAIGGLNSNTPVSVGTVMKIAVKPGRMCGKNIIASEENRRYEIKNIHTGKKSLVFEKNILGLSP